MIARRAVFDVFKDTRELAKVTANMVDALLAGKEVPVNDTKTMITASRWFRPTC